MQKSPFRIAAICFLCLLLPALPAAAQEDDGYVFVRKDFTDNVLWLYMPSVEVREHTSGDYVVGWVRWIFSDTGAAEYAINGIMPHHSMMFYAANPKARQSQTISYTFYDKDYRVIASHSGSFDPSSWSECIPGTTGERIWEVLVEAAGYR